MQITSMGQRPKTPLRSRGNKPVAAFLARGNTSTLASNSSLYESKVYLHAGGALVPAAFRFPARCGNSCTLGNNGRKA